MLQLGDYAAELNSIQFTQNITTHYKSIQFTAITSNTTQLNLIQPTATCFTIFRYRSVSTSHDIQD